MAKLLKDIDTNDIQYLHKKYGVPHQQHFSADFFEFECELVRRSVAKGRHHDITCFIQKDDKYVCIQKPGYADSGIFRAPSGGANPNESIESAAHREMHEETGLSIRLKQFILDLTLDVNCSDGTIPWRWKNASN